MTKKSDSKDLSEKSPRAVKPYRQPKPPEVRLSLWVGGFVVGSWVTITLASIIDYNEFLLWKLGAVFSHFSLAAAWCVLGPGKLKFRLPISLFWLLLTYGLLLIAAPPLLYLIPMQCACIPAVLVLFLTPACLLGLGFGFRARHESVQQPEKLKQHLGIFKFVILAATGFGFIVLARFVQFAFSSELPNPVPFPFIAFLHFFLLLLAFLLRKYAVLAAPIMLLLVGLSIAIQYAIFEDWSKPFHPRQAMEFGNMVFNISLSFSTVFVALMVRLNGYVLNSETSVVVRSVGFLFDKARLLARKTGLSFLAGIFLRFFNA